MFHVLEDEVKAAIDPATYDDQVSLMEMALDRDAIVAAVVGVRQR